MVVKQPDEKFPTAPEGTFVGVCVDEVALGKIKSSFNGEERERDMVRLVWQIEETNEEGKPHIVKQDYTASLDEKAKLKKHLQSWRGRAFTQAELMGFDLETVVGAGCLLNIVHATGRRGGTFANVEGVMKLPKNMEPIKPRDYIRVKDRAVAALPPPRAPKPPQEQAPPEWGISDDDVPF